MSMNSRCGNSSPGGGEMAERQKHEYWSLFSKALDYWKDCSVPLIMALDI